MMTKNKKLAGGAPGPIFGDMVNMALRLRH